MRKTYRRYFLNIIIISALLHIIALLLFLLSDIDSSVKKYKNLFAKKKQAKVIFKDPSKPPQQLTGKPKIYQPKLVGGALSPAPSKSQIPATVPQPPTLPNTPHPKIAEPAPKPIEQPKPIAKKTPPKKSAEKPQTTKIAKKKTTPRPKSQKKVEEKKLTLADIMKGFKKFSQENSVLTLPSQQHFVTVESKNVGKVTEEQLRYERYTAKLFECIGSSFTFLVRKFRLIKKPGISVFDFQFLMHLDRDGRLFSLAANDSGHPQLDRFMIKVVKHASESFPPLPKFFRDNHYVAFPMKYTIPVAYIPSANLYSHRNNQY